MTKSTLRKIFLERRKAFSDSVRHSSAIAAAMLFTNDEYFKTSKRIACYSAYRTEFDTAPIIDSIWQANKICYLPVIAPHSPLLFFSYHRHQPLQQNQYGILEPSKTDATNIHLHQLDIVILPLLAFDLAGHRLGSGGGYYDRTFADMGEKNKRPWLIGLGYSAQLAENLPVDDWDISLDAIITEEKIFTFHQKT